MMFRPIFAFAFAVLVSNAAQAETVAIPGPDGLRLQGNLELAEGKSVTDGMMVLTHGTLAHKDMEIIVALQTGLAERGISTIAPTLSLDVDKREGMYDCAVPHTHKHTDALDEIGLWLDWLERQNVTDIVLAGHSRGGNQTAWFAVERDRAAIKKVILIAPATWYEDKAAAGFKKSHNTLLSLVLPKAEMMVMAGQGDEFMLGQGVLYCPGADVLAESFVSYYKPDPRFHTPNLMTKIKKPTLVIAGSEDTVVAGLIEDTQPIADAGQVELVIVDGADHFFLDFFAEDAADAIEAFIGE